VVVLAIHGVTKQWQHGSMAAWQHGSMAAWQTMVALKMVSGETVGNLEDT
jgi:hypothetical protein